LCTDDGKGNVVGEGNSKGDGEGNGVISDGVSCGGSIGQPYVELMSVLLLLDGMGSLQEDMSPLLS
jgi:hypothetical protein